ncbi:hypothetical protein C8J57DRAFT_1492096 [Mycena rebaudengoi]|nr:hypothetical protein C8J57DRAFT_1495080 [Mycena rebaudengoi]KAJ7291637.1 hypothetical protein C8J57DRAFT_1492096 [Mycena rebaudengoi]
MKNTELSFRTGAKTYTCLLLKDYDHHYRPKSLPPPIRALHPSTPSLPSSTLLPCLLPDSASAALSSADSSALAASTTIDATAIASDIASALGAPSASASTDASATDLSAAEVDVSRAGAARAEMTPVNTEPYQWMFKAEPRW